MTALIVIDDADNEPHEMNETNNEEASTNKVLNKDWMTKLQQASTDIQKVLNHNREQKDDSNNIDNNEITVESVEYIPAMINQLLKETSPEAASVSLSELADARGQSVVRNVVMIEIIITVVLGFTQCFIHDLLMKEKQQQLKHQDQNTNINEHELQNRNEIMQKSKIRLFAWVSDTILELLNNDGSIYFNKNSDTSSVKNSLNQSRIPVLDALLATTGEHNGLVHDAVLQETIIELVPDLNSSMAATTTCANIKSSEQRDSITELRNDFHHRFNVYSINLDPRDFCGRILKENENLESMENVGNSVECLCSNNLFLRQMGSFLYLDDS